MHPYQTVHPSPGDFCQSRNSCPSGHRQRIVRARGEGFFFPADIDTLLRRMIGGDPLAAAEVVDRAASTDCPRLLVAAAVINPAVINPAVINPAAIDPAVIDPAAPQQLLARAANS